MSAIGDGYADVRSRLLDLAADLDADDPHRPVPCTPGWCVKDVFAHVSGVVADALAGNMEGAPGDAWTAAQVAHRADWPLDQVLDEWRGNAPVFDDVVARAGDAMDPRLVADVWAHEQDLRHALGRPGGREGQAAEFVVALVSRGIAGDQSIEWTDEHGTVRRVGAGPVGIRLQASRFDFVRSRLGRRSVAQILALGWDGDAGPWLDRFCVFGPARTTIEEP